jgi:LysM repeat protein
MFRMIMLGRGVMGAVKSLLACLSALLVLISPSPTAARAAQPSPASPATPAEVPPTTPAEAAPAYHVVRPGETIKSIAAAFGVRRRDLRAWNGIRKPHQPAADGVLHLAAPPVRLSGWRSWVETVTPGTVNWDPRKQCPVAPADLRKVWVTYIDFYGVSHQGSIVVHRSIATRTQRAFRTLYRMRFRIQGMSPVTINAPYLTDMGTVTAGYNCRAVSGSTTWSQHAYGGAIDVNPVQNPMVRGSYVDPGGGTQFLRRDLYRRGMLHAAGAVRAFTGNGFFWGGRWHSLTDDMHFSTNNR